jgi:hypothetical protein
VSHLLTDDETRKIRDLIAQGVTASEIARQTGRGRETVRKVAERHALNLTLGQSGKRSTANPRGRVPSGIVERAPKGSLVQRQNESKMPKVSLVLDPDAHEVLSRAAEHRRKTIERLCEDILLGTALRGSIPQQEAKATTYRAASTRQRQEQVISATLKAQETETPVPDSAQQG